jgi:phosphoenolpyruvate synthase/pyruvate phosphate dikinase
MFKIIEDINRFKLLQKEQWDIQGINSVPCFIESGPECGIIGMQKVLGYGYTRFIMQFENDYLQLHYNKEDMKKNFEEFLKRYRKDKSYLKFLMDVDVEMGDELYEFIKHIKPKIDDMTDAELTANYRKLFQTFSDAFNTSHLIESIALVSDTMLKDMLMKELKARTHKDKNDIEKEWNNFNECLTLLTQPNQMPFVVEAENMLYKIIMEVKNNKELKSLLISNKDPKEKVRELEKFSKANDMISNYIDKFYWIKTTWIGGKYLTKADFTEDLKRIIANGEKLNFIEEESFRQREKERKLLLKKLKLSKDLLGMIEITSVTTYWQDIRKIKMLKGILAMQRFISEIAERKGIKEQNLKYIMIEELPLLDDIKPDGAEKLDKMLEERRKASAYLFINDEMTIITGKEYRKFFSEMKEEGSEKSGNEKEARASIKEINGMCASPGKAVGKARICLKPHNISKINEGDILVTSMTRPEFVPAMKKAAAIITDEGGLTCHAAIVSRELGKPCVIGTKVATKALKDGQIVEVNANHGCIRIIR